MDGCNFQAIGFRKPAKNGMERGEHFPDAFGSVIGDLRAGGKTFGSRALKNHEIRFREGAFERRVQRFHHSNVQNIERLPVESNPRRAAFDAKLNGFVVVGHNRGSARDKGLFSLKSCWTPFKEGPNPFAAIFGEIAAELFLDLVLESTDEILLSSRKKFLLHRTNS